MDVKSHYNKKGMYAGYDKNNKERQSEDYYATPPKEAANILQVLNLPLENSTILEPCCGGGHLVKGMIDYCSYTYDSKLWRIIATDIKKRDSVLRDCDFRAGQEYDFLSDNYPYTENIDYIITNPPYSVIEPFVMKSLGIANKGVLILGRLQFIEGKNRYEKIFKECPPTDVYAYINRINCVKNGDFSISSSSVQAYAWFYWDLANTSKETRLHWIWRID